MQIMNKARKNFSVIARDPNMNVSKFSMGEASMLECHYKFGVYEEPLEEPQETLDVDQDFAVANCTIFS